MAVVNVKDVPELLDEWRSINVRDPKLTSGVARKIRESLVNEPEQFFFKNRGLTIMADRVEFDNKTNEVAIEFSSPVFHGLLDGGHTFKVIREHVRELTEDELKEVNALVRLEIIEGFADKEDVIGIVEARNTSTQVKEQSIEELLGHYDQIKKVLADRPYADSIAYKEYELNDEGAKKNLDIKEILSYLVCFDVGAFDGNKHPIIAYSGKGAVIEHFKENADRMRRYIPLLPKILELRDHVYASLPDAYNSTGGKFGRLTDVSERKHPEKLPFSEEKSRHKIPSAFIYPVLGAFRALIACKDDSCHWKDDPIKFFESIKVEVSERIVEQALEFRNPTKMGKDKATWGRCYDLVRLSVLERGL